MEGIIEPLPSLAPVVKAPVAAPKPQLASALHRKPIEPIDIEFLRVEGKRRWLKGPEIYRLLHTFRQSGIAPLDSIVQRPGPGSWFLYSPGIKVRQDGYSYPKKDRNGYPVMQESHVHLQLYNRRVISCYYSRVDDPPPDCHGLTRRLYWLVGVGEEGEAEGEHAHSAVVHTGSGPKGVAFVHYLDADALAAEDQAVDVTSSRPRPRPGAGTGTGMEATQAKNAPASANTTGHTHGSTWAADGRSRKRKVDVPMPSGSGSNGAPESVGVRTRGAVQDGQAVKRQATDDASSPSSLPPPPSRVDLSWGLWSEEDSAHPHAINASSSAGTQRGGEGWAAGIDVGMSMDMDMDLEMNVGLHLPLGMEIGRLTPPPPPAARADLLPARPVGTSVYSGAGEEIAEGASDALSAPNCSDDSSVCSDSDANDDGGSDSSGSWSSDGVSLQNATEKLLDRVATQLAELDGGATVLSGAGDGPGRAGASVGSTVEGRTASRLRSTGTGGGSESRGSSSRHTRNGRRRVKDKGRQSSDSTAALVCGSDPSSGTTLLHMAAAAGNAYWVHTLLTLGADPGLTDRMGRTPLACAQGAAVQAMLAAQPPQTANSRGEGRRRASASAQTDGEGIAASSGGSASALGTPAPARSRASSAASSHTPHHGSTPRPGAVPPLPEGGLGGAMSPTDRAVLLDAFSALSLKDRCAVAVALHMDDRQQQAGNSAGGTGLSGAHPVPSPSPSSHADGLVRSHSAGSHMSMPSQEDTASVRLALTLMSARDILELEVEAKRIQSGVRAWLARRNYRHIKAAAKTLQGAVRRMLAKRQAGSSSVGQTEGRSTLPSLSPPGHSPRVEGLDSSQPSMPPTRPTVPSGSTGASFPPSFLPIVHEGFAGAEDEDEEDRPMAGAGAFHILDERGRQSLPPLPPLPVVPGVLATSGLQASLPTLSSLSMTMGHAPLSLPPPVSAVPSAPMHGRSHGHGLTGKLDEQSGEIAGRTWDEELEWSRQQAAAAAVIARTLKRFYGTAVGGTA